MSFTFIPQSYPLFALGLPTCDEVCAALEKVWSAAHGTARGRELMQHKRWIDRRVIRQLAVGSRQLV